MNAFTTIDSCRLCGNPELAPLLSLGDQYLTGRFPRTRHEPVTRGPLELVRCAGHPMACGLVQLKHSYDATEMYGDNYGYRSSLNQTMVSHLQERVEYLSRLASLSDGDVVLDIGSNDGTTLSFYPETVDRIGIDPTAAKFRELYARGIQVVPDFFSAELFSSASGGRKARIVSSIAMVYDLPRPLDFAREVASVLKDDGIWYLEQSYMPLMLETTGYDTICHEHVEYYALSQIDWMTRRAGLRILDVQLNRVNGGSFGVTVCKTDSRYRSNERAVMTILANERRQALDSSAPFEEFAQRVDAHRGALVGLLDRLNGEGSLVLGYGASTKGNVILQFCDIRSDRIPLIAEVNEEKFGSFTPGTCIPIVSEREAHALKPDYFLAMPWHFRDNLLRREERFLASGGRMIFPLPAIEIAGSGKAGDDPR